MSCHEEEEEEASLLHGTEEEASVINEDRLDDGDGRDRDLATVEIRNEKTWADRGGEEMRYKDERLAVKTEAKGTRERERERKQHRLSLMRL
ncbi:unnamed protein product [Eruca vesicaria subsp. sativa]|uniref:Uncharacterized protein n=1 Tax=Eruca vesicaria subsp. sativa TaxID=29727 RepID=A0ABC8JS43_ERUVS|nr:unnamed protein product [Eruca vesicaria subsp. sativa]